MPLLPIGHGKFVEISEEDVVATGFHSWSPGAHGYIRTEIKGKTILLSKFIGKRMGLDVNQIIDHADRDITNYQRYNLRNATPSQSNHNINVRSSNALGVKGVRQFRNKYRSEIRNPRTGEKIHIGTFGTIEEAKEAYRELDEGFYGEFANPYDE